MMARACLSALTVTIVLTWTTATAEAHSPIQGASKQYKISDFPVLEWQFGGSYPSWLTGAIEAGPE